MTTIVVIGTQKPAVSTPAFAFLGKVWEAIDMKVISSILFLFGVLATQPACSSIWKTDALYHGVSLQEAPVNQVAQSVAKGSIVIVSEQHDLKDHHDKQVEFLKALVSFGHTVSVGMEFFDYTKQTAVDSYLLKTLPEADFLKEVGWGKGFPFDMYREQVTLPLAHGGWTIALNAPRSLTNVISKNGVSSLTPEQLSLLPPHFVIGNSLYFDRFKETMNGHVKDDQIQKYFEAQSAWDDTMAWIATEYQKKNPDKTLVIIVGDFHAAYGGGLPDRLKARGAVHLVTISQVNFKGSSDSEASEDIRHPQWGSRADWIWVSR